MGTAAGLILQEPQPPLLVLSTQPPVRGRDSPGAGSSAQLAARSALEGKPRLSPYDPPATRSPPQAKLVAAMVQAWYMDESADDPRLPHRLEPARPVSLEQLRRLGVLYWKVRAAAGCGACSARGRGASREG